MLSYALAGVGLLVPLAELGLEAVARREFVRSPERTAALAGTVIGLRILGGGAACAVVVAWAFLFETSSDQRRVILILAISLFQPGAMVAESWLQSRLQAKSSVVAQWIALIFGVSLRVFAIGFGAPVEVFSAIVVVELALAAGFVVRSASIQGFKLGCFDRMIAWPLVKECWPLALAGFAVMIYMRIDVLMLNAIAGDVASGEYAAAVRFSELPYFIPMIIAASIQPALARASAGAAPPDLDLMRQYISLSGLAGYAVALPVALFATPVTRLAFGGSFGEAGPVLAIHAWASVFVFLGVARGQYLVNAGLSRFNLLSTVSGALLNVMMNLALIPLWGGRGAAAATVVSYAVSAWLTSFCSARVRQIGWMQTRSILVIPVFWKALWRN